MNYIERAMNEQLRSFICPEQGLGQEQKKGCFTFAQKTGYRRSPEAIIIDAIDRGAKHERTIKQFHVQKQMRKRRRGPRILVL